jgi:hypothetical protein
MKLRDTTWAERIEEAVFLAVGLTISFPLWAAALLSLPR